jgi:hypothetical protein
MKLLSNWRDHSLNYVKYRKNITKSKGKNSPWQKGLENEPAKAAT